MTVFLCNKTREAHVVELNTQTPTTGGRRGSAGLLFRVPAADRINVTEMLEALYGAEVTDTDVLRVMRGSPSVRRLTDPRRSKLKVVTC